MNKIFHLYKTDMYHVYLTENGPSNKTHLPSEKVFIQILENP